MSWKADFDWRRMDVLLVPQVCRYRREHADMHLEL